VIGIRWKTFKKFVREQIQPRKKSRRPPTDRQLLHRSETLEPRNLLAVSQIVFDALASRVVVTGSTSADQVTVSNAQPGWINVRATTGANIVESSFLASTVGSISFNGIDGDDFFENQTNIASVASGGIGNDTLIGGGGGDDLTGGSGNDFLYGMGGADVLNGNTGDDKLVGGAGDDTLLGDIGNDQLEGEAGNDTISGHGGIDVLNGGVGDDKLYGGTENDQLLGGLGNDMLYGESDNDQLYGNEGLDYLHGGAGGDTLLGGSENDQLVGDTGDDNLYGESGADQLYGNTGFDYLHGGVGDDVLYGGTEDDYLVGDAGNDTMYGESGNDQLNADAGLDYLHGGAGNDTLYGGENNDELAGDIGDDNLHGEGGVDILYGHAGNDYLFGGLGDDEIWGGTDNDTAYGDDGDDRIYGEAGNDWLYGYAGNDYLHGAVGNDRIFGGAGNDELLGDAGNDWLYGQDDRDIIHGHADNDYIYGGTADDEIYGGMGDDHILGETGNDRIHGESGNDQIHGQQGIDYLHGGAGDDKVWGGTENDELIGDAGNDFLYGQDGNDLVSGHAGDNFLDGGAGDDELIGGSDSDEILGGLGNDEVWAGSGNDLITAGDGADIVHGGTGDDQLYGGVGNDDLQGDDGNDVLYGEAGSDSLNGLFGNDLLFGGADGDNLNGYSGNDVLVGGGSADTLVGGGQDDILIGGNGLDSLDGESGSDLLIGGRTVFDDDLHHLEHLAEVWGSAISYDAKLTEIQSDEFHAKLESNATVLDDLVADILFGGTDQDWFFQTGVVMTYTPIEDEHEEPADGGEEAHGDHHHALPTIVHELPPLEGFDFMDSLDKLSDISSGERIHSKLPHPENATLQKEHLSLFELVRYDQVTHTAIASGNWSNPSIWQNGVVPSDGARVHIPMDVEVTVDRIITQRIGTIRIDGTLSFSTTQNSELRVDTIVGSVASKFEMGSAERPIPRAITARLLFTDNGPIDRAYDPFGLSRGLISHGAVSIHGAEVTSQSAVNGALEAGGKIMKLTMVPTGWKVGDEIVIAGTTAEVDQNEVRRIAGIFGNVVFFDQPLQYNHTPESASSPLHVAHLTRNAIIESESNITARRGHTMFMHNRDVEIAYAGFYGLGRTDKSTPINDAVVKSDWTLTAGTGTNQRARYAVHFHRNGLTNDGHPSTVIGSAVVDSPGWGYVNHSSYVDFVDNVAYNVNGAAFVTEVGDEIGSFRKNLAIGSTGSGEALESRLYIQDFGHQGDGFWFQGSGISVTDNVAAGNEGNGFVFFARGLIEGGVTKQFLSANLQDPSIANGATMIDVTSVPVFAFKNNAAYASATGLAVWYHLRTAEHQQKGVFEDSAFWNNTLGMDVSYAANTIFRDLKVVDTTGAWPHTAISSNAIALNIEYDNLTVTGYNRGLVVAKAGYTIVNGGYFNNQYNIVVESATRQDRSVLIQGNITFGQLPPSRQMAQHYDVYLRADFAPYLESTDHYFYRSTVRLNYGPFVNRQLYMDLQLANAVPFPAQTGYVPAEYVGLTTQQLWNLYGIAIGGSVAPSGVIPTSMSNGLLAPL
jgi:Ca2+-binding RTX toxin-like protein